MTRTVKQLDPQAVAASIRNNLMKRQYINVVAWLKKLPQDVCVETLLVACDGVEPQTVTRLLEYLGFDSNTQYDVFAMLGCDAPMKETPTFFSL